MSLGGSSVIFLGHLGDVLNRGMLFAQDVGEPILTTFGNWDNEIFAFFDVVEDGGKRLTNAYTECQNGLTRAIDRLGRGYSFDALRVKLLLAPKKQGIVTSYRSVRRKRAQSAATRQLVGYSLARTAYDDHYETTEVKERKPVNGAWTLPNLRIGWKKTLPVSSDCPADS